MVLGVNWTSITYCRTLEEVAWGANNAPIINQYTRNIPIRRVQDGFIRTLNCPFTYNYSNWWDVWLQLHSFNHLQINQLPLMSWYIIINTRMHPVMNTVYSSKQNKIHPSMLNKLHTTQIVKSFRIPIWSLRLISK